MGTITILPETTKNPITLMGQRAGCCWNANVSDDEKNYKRGLDCIKSGHGRVMEYANVEMIIDGYSARTIREWYTHLGGTPTRLQASTRYIDYNNFTYVTPTSIKKNTIALQIYKDMMSNISTSLKSLEALSIPKEDAAMGLPLAMTTKIVDKRNLRNLVDMSRQRMCSRAYHEYRELFKDICNALREYSDEWKWIVDNLFHAKCDEVGYCTEAKSCGRKPKRQ
jgi:thymidylate synthase (FAD)